MVRRYAAIMGFVMALAVAVTVASADDFWVKKDWKQWSKDDCKKMLTNSPWAVKISIQKSLVGPGLPSDNSNVQNSKDSATGTPGKNQGGGVMGPDATGQAGSSAGAGGETTEDVNYVIFLESAPPIREALVRQQQIEQHYDQMNGDQKKQFDAKVASFLEKPWDTLIWVHIEYFSGLQAFSRQLAEYWQNRPADPPPNDLYLVNEHGDKIFPVQFSSTKEGGMHMDIAFPRMVNDEPVVHSGDKVIRLVFTSPKINDITESHENAEFKLDKMMVGGKVLY